MKRLTIAISALAASLRGLFRMRRKPTRGQRLQQRTPAWPKEPKSDWKKTLQHHTIISKHTAPSFLNTQHHNFYTVKQKPPARPQNILATRITQNNWLVPAKPGNICLSLFFFFFLNHGKGNSKNTSYNCTKRCSWQNKFWFFFLKKKEKQRIIHYGGILPSPPSLFFF